MNAGPSFAVSTVSQCAHIARAVGRAMSMRPAISATAFFTCVITHSTNTRSTLRRSCSKQAASTVSTSGGPGSSATMPRNLGAGVPHEVKLVELIRHCLRSAGGLRGPSFVLAARFSRLLSELFTFCWDTPPRDVPRLSGSFRSGTFTVRR